MLHRALLRVLMLVALVVAPLSIMSGHAAMAMPMSAAAGEHAAAMPDGDGHCSGRGEQDRGDQDGRDMDMSIACMIACAGMMPDAPVVPGTRATAPAPVRAAVIVARHGLNPAAEPPPPRLS